jgi:hypothetical protein
MRYRPTSVVIVLEDTPVRMSIAITSTFGTAAPLESAIKPVMAPRSPWPNIGTARTNTTRANTLNEANLLDIPTPFDVMD